jgi:hypothetical protein
MLKENGFVVKILKRTTDYEMLGSFGALTRDTSEIGANFFGVSLLQD